jgi:hypothetical protein
MEPFSLLAVLDSFAGDEIPCLDVWSAAAVLAPVPEISQGGPDRFLEIRGSCGGFVSIYVHPRETLLDALRQCAEEIRDPWGDLAFDNPIEEKLARAAVPELLKRLETGPGS